MMGIGHPFPFLIVDPAQDKLGAIRSAGEPYIIRHAPPHPEGQRKGGAKPGTASGGMGGMGGMSGMRGMGRPSSQRSDKT